MSKLHFHLHFQTYRLHQVPESENTCIWSNPFHNDCSFSILWSICDRDHILKCIPDQSTMNGAFKTLRHILTHRLPLKAKPSLRVALSVLARSSYQTLRKCDKWLNSFNHSTYHSSIWELKFSDYEDFYCVVCDDNENHFEINSHRFYK